MKDIDFKDKSSARIFGKGVVIVIVILFSSLSFVLGYFVGRLGREDRATQGRALETAVSQTGNPALQPARLPAPATANSVPAGPSQAVPPEGPDQSSFQTKNTNTPASPGDAGREAPKGVPSKTLMPPAKGQSKEVSNGKEVSKESTPVAQPKQTFKDTYTVQLGALKNASEAKKVRHKFEKKGYKTYLSVTRNGKHQKIYKIRVGEFKEKKDAEVLALKLKKVEGLNTFVTVKK
jgi:cell division septation protein DedD